jgi:hypothetical protein
MKGYIMMKTYFFNLLSLVVLLVPSAVAKLDIEDKLNDAVLRVNEVTLKRFLDKYEKSGVSVAVRQSKLKELAEVAAENIEDLKENLSVTSNLWDMAKIAIGAGLAIPAFNYTLKYVLKYNKKRENNNERIRYGTPPKSLTKHIAMIIPPTAALVASAFVAYKGIQCSAQVSKIKKAQEIQQLVEDAATQTK